MNMTAVAVQFVTAQIAAEPAPQGEASEANVQETGSFSEIVNEMMVPGSVKEEKSIPNEMMGELSELMNGMLCNPFAVQPETATETVADGWMPEGIDVTAVQPLAEDPTMGLMEELQAAQESLSQTGSEAMPAEFELEQTLSALAQTTSGTDAPVNEQQMTAVQSDWQTWQSDLPSGMHEAAQSAGVPTGSSETVQPTESLWETGAMSQVPTQAMAQPQGDAQSETQGGFSESDFFQYVRQTKELLAQESAQQTNEPDANLMDLDALIQEAKQLTAADMMPTEGMTTEETAKSIAAQTLDGITQQLSKAENSFTIKLSPEGLGDIIVNLQKSADGSLLLNLIAANEKTAQCLNQEMASLQTALAQHNTEIGQITVEKTDSSMLYQQFNEQLDSQTHGGSQQFRQETGAGWASYAEDDSQGQIAELQARTSLPESGLNTYI